MEDAVTDRAQDACGGDLEDGLFNANRKAEITYNTVVNFAKREKLRRNPCGFWARMFSSRCR